MHRVRLFSFCLVLLQKQLGKRYCSSAGRGFTLLELMVVVAIIGTLAAIAIPTYSGYRERAVNNSAILDLRTIELTLDIFWLENSRFPDDLAEVGLDTMMDPWGNPYQYLPVEGTPPGKLRKDHALVPVNTDFDLYSMGKDGASISPFTAAASQDDIVRANDGGYFGLVSNY